MTEEVTVILTVYNKPQYLDMQIEAIKNQTVKPKEIMLWYNKGNSDQKKIEDEDKDLHHYHSGIAKRSFNLGWKIARRFDLTKIDGSMKDGLLKLFIPLTPESKPKTVSIK